MKKKMINRKFTKNKIVYVIPPTCIKFLKRKSFWTKCPDSSPKCAVVEGSEIGVNDWNWKSRGTTKPVTNTGASGKTKQPSRSPIITPLYQTTPTTTSSQVRTTTALPFTQLTTPFSSKATTTANKTAAASKPATSIKTATTKRVSTIYEPLRTDTPTTIFPRYEASRTDKPTAGFSRSTQSSPSFQPSFTDSTFGTKSTAWRTTPGTTKAISSPITTRYTPATSTDRSTTDSTSTARSPVAISTVRYTEPTSKAWSPEATSTFRSTARAPAATSTAQSTKRTSPVRSTARAPVATSTVRFTTARFTEPTSQATSPVSTSAARSTPGTSTTRSTLGTSTSRYTPATSSFRSTPATSTAKSTRATSTGRSTRATKPARSTRATSTARSSSATPSETQSTPGTVTTGKSSTPWEMAAPNKCLEWYNKIKDDDQCGVEGGGKCAKWYNLIKDDDKGSCSSELKKSVSSPCCKNPSREVKCLNSSAKALNRVDKYLDTRTGIEYLEPIFPSPTVTSEVLDNPFMEFLISRPSSNKKGTRTDVFNLTIDDRIRTLKWLNQQILQRYGMLTKIDKSTRINRSFSNSSNVKITSRRILANNSRKSTRGQRLRDEFIRKKMQRVCLDKNDGWWKNFNSKTYRKNSSSYFLNSSIQQLE